MKKLNIFITFILIFTLVLTGCNFSDNRNSAVEDNTSAITEYSEIVDERAENEPTTEAIEVAENSIEVTENIPEVTENITEVTESTTELKYCNSFDELISELTDPMDDYIRISLKRVLRQDPEVCEDENPDYPDYWETIVTIYATCAWEGYAGTLYAEYAYIDPYREHTYGTNFDLPYHCAVPDYNGIDGQSIYTVCISEFEDIYNISEKEMEPFKAYEIFRVYLSDDT